MLNIIVLVISGICIACLAVSLFCLALLALSYLFRWIFDIIGEHFDANWAWTVSDFFDSITENEIIKMLALTGLRILACFGRSSHGSISFGSSSFNSHGSRGSATGRKF